MLLQLKQKHINNGIQESPCNCPIALAIREALDIREDEYVSVDDDEIFIESYDGKIIRCYRPTKKIVEFIERFDHKGKKAVKPTTFKLERADR
jgi:hypothetical protein